MEEGARGGDDDAVQPDMPVWSSQQLNLRRARRAKSWPLLAVLMVLAMILLSISHSNECVYRRMQRICIYTHTHSLNLSLSQIQTVICMRCAVEFP